MNADKRRQEELLFLIGVYLRSSAANHVFPLREVGSLQFPRLQDSGDSSRRFERLPPEGGEECLRHIATS
jgi:hypothetical protein